MMSEKRFKSPIENALCGCQFGIKLGKNRFLTPNERVLSFQVKRLKRLKVDIYYKCRPLTCLTFIYRFWTSVPNFVEIGSKLRP